MIFHGESGVVQEQTGQKISILFESRGACDTCGLKVVCTPGKTAQRRLTLPIPSDFSIGQKVQIEEIGNLELHLALIQFGLPTIAFLFGLSLGYVIPQGVIANELMSFMMALFGLGGSFFMARKMVQKLVALIPTKYLRVKTLSLDQ